MAQLPQQEGLVPFEVPEAGKPCNTWYKTYGNIAETTKTPLIILHGGPGACHEYLLNHSQLTEKHGIPTIFYDQIGNGQSTRLPEKNGDEAFWQPALFVRELQNLISHLGLQRFSLLGQSWGGQLGTAFASLRPQGLQHLIIQGTPANNADWPKTIEKLYARLPADVRATLLKCEAEGRTDSQEYEDAMHQYHIRFLCKLDPFPPELITGFEHLAGDTTVYGTMWGPSESYVTGSLRDYDLRPMLKDVEVPVLLLNGTDDEAQDEVVKPFFEGLRRVKWFTFDNAAHMVHLDQEKRYFEVVTDFLLSS